MPERIRSSSNSLLSSSSEVVLLLMETGFFRGITRNTFQGYMHRSMVGGVEARFIGVKTKDCPNSSPRTRWLSSVSLRKKSSLWGLRCALGLTKPRRWARAERCYAISPAWAQHLILQQFKSVPKLQ